MSEILWTQQEAVAQADQQFMAEYNQGRASGVADCYTEEAQIMPAHEGSIAGRENIQAFWQALMDTGVKTVRLETVEVDVVGDETVIEVGKYTLLDGQEQVYDAGKYLVVWKTGQGQWKIHRNIWTTNLPSHSEK